eukprot:567406-Rhodomonas_salina.1
MPRSSIALRAARLLLLSATCTRARSTSVPDVNARLVSAKQLDDEVVDAEVNAKQLDEVVEAGQVVNAAQADGCA